MKRRGAFQGFQKGQVLTGPRKQPAGKGLLPSEEAGEGPIRVTVAFGPL